MKRFTASEKWDDPWFWELTPQAKLLWLFLLDHCDGAGIIELNFRFASVKIGATINEKHLAELQSRLHALPCGKSLVIGFIRFQYGSLSRDCKPHNPVFASLAKHGLELAQVETLSKGFAYPLENPPKGIHTLQEKEKEKEPDKAKEPVKEKEGFFQIGIDAIPAVLNTPAFLETWGRWHDHLKQKRKPATILARDLQLGTMAKLGEVRAIAAINNSIEHNYQGIYENSNGSGFNRDAKPVTPVKGSSPVGGF